MTNRYFLAIAEASGFHEDKYGLFWDDDANSEGVNLEQAFQYLVKDIIQVINKYSRTNDESDMVVSVLDHLKQSIMSRYELESY